MFVVGKSVIADEQACKLQKSHIVMTKESQSNHKHDYIAKQLIMITITFSASEYRLLLITCKNVTDYNRRDSKY